jgi:hypothetical protein
MYYKADVAAVKTGLEGLESLRDGLKASVDGRWTRAHGVPKCGSRVGFADWSREAERLTDLLREATSRFDELFEANDLGDLQAAE